MKRDQKPDAHVRAGTLWHSTTLRNPAHFAGPMIALSCEMHTTTAKRNVLRALGCSLLFFGSITMVACGSDGTKTPNPSGGAGSGGAGGDGGSGGMPITCTWTKKTSNATCPNGACPIVLDEQLICDDWEFAAPGVRVAPAPDGTWLVTASSNERYVYRLTGSADEKQDGLPQPFMRTPMVLALDTKGAPQIVADTTLGPDYVGGINHAKLENGSFALSTVHDRPDKYVPVIDFEVGPDDVPHVWFVDDAPSSFGHAIPDGKGGWKVDPLPPTYDHFTLASDGSIVALAAQGDINNGIYQLHVQMNGVDTPVGKSFPTFGFSLPQVAIAATPMPMPIAGLKFAAALAAADGLHVIREASAAGVKEDVIAAAKQGTPVCKTPIDNALCVGTCKETMVEMEPRAFAVGWTNDGTVWLGYIETTYDQTIAYSLQGDPGAEFCVGNVDSDSSKGTLHLYRFAIDGSAPQEVLTMPIERPGGGDSFGGSFGDYYGSGRSVDVRGFGKDLAIGVRTGFRSAEKAVRVLRLDTTMF